MRSTAVTARQPPFPYRPRLSDFDRRVWRSFVTAHARVMRALDDELHSAHGLDLPSFEVLYELVTAPGNQLRMAELAHHLVYSRGGVTRLVNRLTERGYLERTTVHDDARGVYASLTGAGYQAFVAAANGHVETIRRLFFGPLGDDASAFAEILERIDGNGRTSYRRRRARRSNQPSA
jgi:DNA-binding MarR family transcriptional regulator